MAQPSLQEIRPKKPSDEASAPFRMFLGLKFCNVGFGGKNCTQRLAVRPCGPRDDGCFYHPEYGTAVVSKERWLGAQAVEQETWDTRDTDEDRNAAHAVSYNGYAALPQELGDAIEIACGPFTQIKTILRTGRTVSSLTLLDPGAFHYMNSVRRSSYKNGLLKAPGVVANTVLSFPAEETPSLTHSFDTVVMINVIEHVLDAFTTFEKVYHMLRPGGLFLWHDRLWDGYQGRPGTGPRDGGALREFQLHPIRLKKSFADRFVQLFDPLFDSRDTPELRRLQNQGIYFIGRKRAGDTLPPPAPVADRVTVVLLTHPGSNRKNYLLRHLRSYHKMQIVAYIVLILNGADAPFDLEPFADKLILKAFSINSMNNRFRIEREVMTEAVLMVDDDVLLPPMTVACLHRHWSADKLRLFGMDPRALHRGEYKYNAHADGSYSAVVGKTMFFHRDYLSAYVADNAVQYYVNPEGANSTPPEELNFCEDLAMVVLIAAKSGKAPMAVDDHGMRADLDNNGDGLSLAKGWPEMRIKCIKWLTAHYGLKALPTERHRYQCPAALQPSGPATARFGSNLL